MTVLGVLAVLVAACSADGTDQGASTDDSGSVPSSDGPLAVTTSKDPGDPVSAIDGDPDLVQLDGPAGEVVIASGVPVPQSMDPHVSMSQADLTAMSLTYDRLLELNNNLEPAPMLATEWSYTDDGSAFEMTLREDVVFSDGTPFNAAAVVFNIERAKAVEGSFTALSLIVVESVEAVGEHQVRFELLDGVPRIMEQLLAEVPGFMISPSAPPAVLPGEGEEPDPTLFSGTGPYQLTDFTPFQSASFVPVENYWSPGRQLASGVRLQFQQSNQARLEGLVSGEYDVVGVQGDQIDEAIALGEEGEFRYLRLSQQTLYAMWMNPNLGDLASPEIRQAILYAMNRNDFVDNMLGGTCESRFQLFPLGSPYFFPEVESRYHYDPEEARRLVEESGIESPEFTVTVSEDFFGQLAERLQGHLAEVGITMNLEQISEEQSSTPWMAGEAEAAYLAIPGAADPALLVDGMFSRLPPWQGLIQSEVGEEMTTARSLSPGDPARVEAYREVISDINDLALYAPGCTVTTVWMWGADVVGVDTMPYLWSGIPAPYKVGRNASEGEE